MLFTQETSKSPVKSLRHASFVFHQWAKFMLKSSQLLGKIVVWSTGVRKPGNIIMRRGTGQRDMTEKVLKTALNPNQLT